MIIANFNSVNGILYTTITGPTTIDDLNDWLKGINSNNVQESCLKLITDARNASYNFTADDSKPNDKILKDLCARYTWIKAAVIHKNPKETALSMVMKTRVGIPNYTQMIFSTLEAAENWIMNF